MPIVTQGRSRGFTLVEMSIVLVIIGLIIGGILKGQEVIAGARQKAVINQANAVRSATSTYFDRYRALPGDDPTANAVLDVNLNSGDGNGIVGVSVALNATVATEIENYTFFNGMIAANLLNGGAVTASAGTVPALNFGSTALPAAPISGAGLNIARGTHNGDGTAATVRTTHWLRVQKSTAAPAASASPRTLQNIDSQIDDGMPYTGGVRDGFNIDVAGCANAAINAGIRYRASDDLSCVPVFEIAQ